jgi:RNase P/RNase MRP subunit POP5
MTKNDFSKLLVQALKRLYGSIGTAEFPQNLSVRYYDAATNLCILRCNRGQKTQVVAAIFTITEYQLQKLLVRLVKESGTIGPIQKAAIAFNKARAVAQKDAGQAARRAESQLVALPMH